MVLGGNTYNVLSFAMNINQMTDMYGVPRDRVRCETINVIIESSGKDDEITEWATSPKMKKNGQITFFKRDASAIGKSVAFEDAYCISHSTNYTDDDSQPMTISISLSAMCVKINDKYTVQSPTHAGSKGGEKSSSSSSSSSSDSKEPISTFKAAD